MTTCGAFPRRQRRALGGPIALPIEGGGGVRVELSGAEGRLLVTGRSVRSEERGEPRFVERL